MKLPAAIFTNAMTFACVLQRIWCTLELFHFKRMSCMQKINPLFSDLTIIFPSSQWHRGWASADSGHQRPQHHQMDLPGFGTCEQVSVLPALLHHSGLWAYCQRGMHHNPGNKWVFEGPHSTQCVCVCVRAGISLPGGDNENTNRSTEAQNERMTPKLPPKLFSLIQKCIELVEYDTCLGSQAFHISM